jgi:methylated-DNA-[protein]-cysteine S-methyltransferase
MEDLVFYTWMESPVGRLLLAADEAGLRKVQFGGEPAAHWREDAMREDAVREDAGRKNPAPLAETMRQLRAYFAGELREFDLPLAPEGTPFQLRVWRELRNIPHGQTISYGELARRVGSPKGSRAVGLANGANPISIVIPCHRVIGSNGKLTGYGGGLENKERLLALEREHPLFAK